MDGVVNSREDGYFTWYAEHAKNLRTALVGYGAGFLALIVTNENVLKAVKASCLPKTVVSLFLGAIAIQIALVLINKYLAWLAYDVERKSEADDSKRRKKIERWSEAIFIDIGVDILTGLLLLIGTGFVVFGAL